MNIELMDPNGNMVTTLDLWSLDPDSGNATFYADDGVFAPVLDDNKRDNFVVKDSQEEGRGVLIEGTGPDILVPFAKMVEFASFTELRDDFGEGFKYTKLTDPSDRTESNSNGMAVALAQFAGFSIPSEVEKETDEGFWSGEWTPGKDDNLVDKMWPKGRESEYADYDSDPQGLLSNPEKMGELYNEIDQLNLKNQQDEIREDYKNVPPGPAGNYS